MTHPTAPSGTVRVLRGPSGEEGREGHSAAPTRVTVTTDGDDRNSRAVVEALEALRGPGLEVVVRDAREEPAADRFLQRLVCCGPVTPVVTCGGLLLTAPTPAEAVLAVRRVVPGSVG